MCIGSAIFGVSTSIPNLVLDTLKLNDDMSNALNHYRKIGGLLRTDSRMIAIEESICNQINSNCIGNPYQPPVEFNYVAAGSGAGKTELAFGFKRKVLYFALYGMIIIA